MKRKEKERKKALYINKENFHTKKKNLHKMKKTKQPPVGCKVSWVCTNRREEANSRREELQGKPRGPHGQAAARAPGPSKVPGCKLSSCKERQLSFDILRVQHSETCKSNRSLPKGKHQ